MKYYLHTENELKRLSGASGHNLAHTICKTQRIEVSL